MKAGPFGDDEKFEKKTKMRILSCLIDSLGFIDIHSAKYQKIEGGPFGTIKKFS